MDRGGPVFVAGEVAQTDLGSLVIRPLKLVLRKAPTIHTPD